MKSVAIIGAGPGGLVAAKTLLRMFPKKFDVTIFEKQEKVGGLWAVDPETHNKIMNPHMTTNLSKYTMSFSDLSWNSVDLTSTPHITQHDAKPPHSSSVPMFPSAWRAGRYLETYREKFIPDNALRLNCEVTEVSPLVVGPSSRWTIKWCQGAQTDSSIFDFVVICTGFCASPLPFLNPDSGNISPSGSTGCPKIMHSSTVRSLNDLMGSEWAGEGDILVVGGTMSGVEAAATLALEISSRQYTAGLPVFKKPKVIHVFPHPFYITPRYIPQNSGDERPVFLPLDLCFYNLDRRPDTSTTAAIGRMSSDKAQLSHEYLRSKVGGDQSDLRSQSLMATSLNEAPYVAIATGASYAEFVRNGQIVAWHGRVDRVERDSSTPSSFIAVLSQKDGSAKCGNIGGIVNATGYTPRFALGILSDDVKRELEFDKYSNRLPLILTDSQTHNMNVPGLAFVGVHEGAFWGTAESQARKIASRWVNEQSKTTASQTHVEMLEKEKETLRDLRHAMHERATDVPQLWSGDYVGLMEHTVTSQCAQRDDDKWGGRRGPVFPARYIDWNSHLTEENTTAQEICNLMGKAVSEGFFVAHAAFFALQGSWNIHRELKSARAESPSGSLVGKAVFEPRHATSPEFDAEYLYIEKGEFKTTQGLTMKASRRYIYRYNESDDLITAWFAKEDGKTVDYLFLDLKVVKEADGSGKSPSWVFRSKHLCTPDTYDAKYTFHFRGAALDNVVIQYKVTGPKKDYTSTTSYHRPIF